MNGMVGDDESDDYPVPSRLRRTATQQDQIIPRTYPKKCRDNSGIRGKLTHASRPRRPATWVCEREKTLKLSQTPRIMTRRLTTSQCRKHTA